MKLHERGLAMSKILIVEDEESIADIEKDYLELNGYEVEVCNDGTSLSLIHISEPTRR